MAHHDRDNRLATLDEWELENSDQDLRGETVFDENKKPVGKVDDMLVDTQEERVYALRLEDGRLVNVDYVDIRDNGIFLLVDNGRIPQTNHKRGQELTTKAIPIVEERLEVGKRKVALGKVRIKKRVKTDTVTEDVKLREEHVDVERRPATRSVGRLEDAFKNEAFEVTEYGERPVVNKEAVVTDEVVVKKSADTHKERVQDEVRKTEVDVDRDRKTGTR